MNNRRRQKLRESLSLLDSARMIVEEIKYEEEDSLRNLPESFQDSTKSSTMEDAIDALDSAIESIHEAEEGITSVL